MHTDKNFVKGLVVVAVAVCLLAVIRTTTEALPGNPADLCLVLIGLAAALSLRKLACGLTLITVWASWAVIDMVAFGRSIGFELVESGGLLAVGAVVGLASNWALSHKMSRQKN